MKKETEEFMMETYRSWEVVSSLEYLTTDEYGTWYRCPFGCGCGAYTKPRSTPRTFDLSVLYCPICDRFAWFDVVGFVLNGISSEEKKMFDILKRHEEIEDNSLTPERACMMWHSQGLPEEAAAEASTDIKKFYLLVEQHKEASRNNRFATVYS